MVRTAMRTKECDKHVSLSREHLTKAEEALSQGEPRRASQYGWATVGCLLSAIAETRGLPHMDRTDLCEVVRRLEKESGDPELTTLYEAASLLGYNYGQDFGWPKERVADELKRVKRLLGKLDRFILASVALEEINKATLRCPFCDARKPYNPRPIRNTAIMRELKGTRYEKEMRELRTHPKNCDCNGCSPYRYICQSCGLEWKQKPGQALDQLFGSLENAQKNLEYNERSKSAEKEKARQATYNAAAQWWLSTHSKH